MRADKLTVTEWSGKKRTFENVTFSYNYGVLVVAVEEPKTLGDHTQNAYFWPIVSGSRLIFWEAEGVE